MDGQRKQQSKIFIVSSLNKNKHKFLNYISSKRKSVNEVKASTECGILEEKDNTREREFESSSPSVNPEYSEIAFSDPKKSRAYSKSPSKSKTELRNDEPGPSLSQDLEIVEIHSSVISDSTQSSPHHYRSSSPSQTQMSAMDEEMKRNSAVNEPMYATVEKNKYKRLAENLLKDNEQLQREIQEYLSKSRIKETTLHNQLKLEMTQFEEETKREVSTLKERTQILMRERGAFKEQAIQLQKVKEEMTVKLTLLGDKIKSMTSPEEHKKIVADYSKLLNTEREKHREETALLKHQCEVSEQEKQGLLQQMEDLKGQLATSQQTIEHLSEQNQQMIHERSECLEELSESKLITNENQRLLLALLQVTENLAVERDILLNRTFFQDNQQKELHTTVMDYSLNLGRLQEHISNKSKDTIGELLKFQSDQYNQEEKIQEIYGKQLDILREKILNQNNSIYELENEKRKLQSHLENAWDSSDIEGKAFLNKANFL